MPVMNKTRLIICSIGLFLITKAVQAQATNNLSSSPYSLYGLGLTNELNTGKTNAMANTGIAMPSKTVINGLNPASLGAMPRSKFLYDVGVKLEQERLSEGGKTENKVNGNFSDLAIAFPLTEKSGLGFTLIPVTSVGYSIMGLESPIDGSTDTFTADIEGSGGLSNLQANYGYSVTDKFRLGIRAAYLFGQIKQDETDYIESSVLEISEKDSYNGLRLSAGLQYDVSNSISLGGMVNFPTNLSGSQTRTVSLDGVDTLDETTDLDTFKLPLEVGLGVYTRVKENLFVNVDYKRNFWGATNQTDYIGEYVDQSIIGVGAEYTPRRNATSYWQRVNYGAGFSLDNGNLSIKGDRINNYKISLGVGLPIDGSRKNSMLNLSYSYSQRGRVSNGLIKENFHTLTLNLSLEDLWFLKRKID